MSADELSARLDLIKYAAKIAGQSSRVEEILLPAEKFSVAVAAQRVMAQQLAQRDADVLAALDQVGQQVAALICAERDAQLDRVGEEQRRQQEKAEEKKRIAAHAAEAERRHQEDQAMLSKMVVMLEGLQVGAAAWLGRESSQGPRQKTGVHASVDCFR